MNIQQCCKTPASMKPTALLRALSDRFRIGAGLAFLAALVGVLAPSSAFAASDAKTHPAAFCRPSSSLGTGDAVFKIDGTIVNESTTEALEVVCPVIRDNTQSGNNDYWNVKVYVVDETENGLVKCRASARANVGGEFGAVRDSTGIAFTGDYMLDMTVESQSVDGYAVVTCVLPPAVDDPASGVSKKSKIIMYRSEEEISEDPTTDSKSMTGVFAEFISNFDLVNTGPFVEYTKHGAAQSVYPQQIEAWAFPIVRDNHASLWDRVRIRMRLDSEDNAVLCTMSAYNQDGTQEGDAGGIGGVTGPGNVVLTVDPFLEDRTLSDGPYALFCIMSGGMTSLPMYDYREL